MSDIGEREKVQVLLAEYTALRNESNARISSSYVVGGAIAMVIVWLLQQPISMSWGIAFVIALLGFGYCARVLSFDAVNAAVRVRELEGEINRRVGEKLLVWESERGGLNPGYWRAVFFHPLSKLWHKPPSHDAAIAKEDSAQHQRQ